MGKTIQELVIDMKEQALLAKERLNILHPDAQWNEIKGNELWLLGMYIASIEEMAHSPEALIVLLKESQKDIATYRREILEVIDIYPKVLELHEEFVKQLYKEA